MIPGMYPRMVNRMLMRKSALQPRSKKTPTGGMKMAKMILMMSDPVKAIAKGVMYSVCVSRCEGAKVQERNCVEGAGGVEGAGEKCRWC